MAEKKNINTGSETALNLKMENNKVFIIFSGDWTKDKRFPDVDKLLSAIDVKNSKMIVLDASALKSWDSVMLKSLIKISDFCKDKSLSIDQEALPEGIRKLLALATAVPERKGAHRDEEDEGFFRMVGNSTFELMNSCGELLEFVGNAFITLFRLIRRKAQFRKRDLFLFMEECGAQALPIVSLISILFGLILAFVGSIQLKMFGAEVYIANLVSLGMAREMGALMTGIIMTGRTGSSYAAQLGTMQVNEEISALRTLGINPMEFLVLPRMLALIVMMPLLCIYSNVVGMLGGAVVGIGMMNLSMMEYFNQTATSVTLTDFGIGLFKSSIFGILIALSGCLRGMQCGRSASEVGRAATSAVVTGIVAIVIADSVVTVICSVLGI